MWMFNMAEAWAKYSNSNVCLINWNLLAKNSYSNIKNIQLKHVVHEFVKYFEMLRKNGMDYTKVSIAGRGLGLNLAELFDRTIKTKGWEIHAIYSIHSNDKNDTFYIDEKLNYKKKTCPP